MRIYDPRIGRFLSEDPIAKKYPELTPYQFASNSPIRNIDIDGLEVTGYDQNLDRWITELGKGKITKEQYEKRLFATGIGGVVGLAVLGIGYTAISAPNATSLILRSAIAGSGVNAAITYAKGGSNYEIIKSTTSGAFSGAILAFGGSSVGGILAAGGVSGGTIYRFVFFSNKTNC